MTKELKFPKRLYHGTSAARLDAILKDGLTPRSKRKAKSNDKSFNSAPNVVYLTDAYAIKFGVDAMMAHRAKHKKDKDKYAIIEIDTTRLDSWGLVPDDDILALQFERERGLDMQAAVKAAQKELRNYCGEDQAAASLRMSGSCAYLGTISPAHFTRAAIVDYEAQKWFSIAGWDVGTGPQAYHFTRPRHLDRLRWIFDNARPEVPEGMPPEFADAFFKVPETRDGIEVRTLNEIRDQENRRLA